MEKKVIIKEMKEGYKKSSIRSNILVICLTLATVSFFIAIGFALSKIATATIGKIPVVAYPITSMLVFLLGYIVAKAWTISKPKLIFIGKEPCIAKITESQGKKFIEPLYFPSSSEELIQLAQLSEPIIKFFLPKKQKIEFGPQELAKSIETKRMDNISIQCAIELEPNITLLREMLREISALAVDENNTIADPRIQKIKEKIACAAANKISEKNLFCQYPTQEALQSVICELKKDIQNLTPGYNITVAIKTQQTETG